MEYNRESLEKHYKWKGKIGTICRVPLATKEDMSLAYTPGVAAPCLEIQSDVKKSFDLTRRANLVAVVTDGTAVLGLGDIGPEASMPVMEGKCALFKAFADVDAFPICVRSKNIDDIVNTVRLIAGSFGGINLEDISAPRCFEIERRLKECCDIPVFHDDQHGTAVVTLAAIINALKLRSNNLGPFSAHSTDEESTFYSSVPSHINDSFTLNKKLEGVSVIVNGAGAAGIAVIRLLVAMGLKNVILCDRHGAIYDGRDGLNQEKEKIAKITNLQKKSGTLEDVIKGANIFIGVSAPNCVTAEMIKSMSDNPIIFAMANPIPEIMPDLAKDAGASVIGTGRSDFPNQINNVLAFPGIFRGALDARASDINDEMKIAAAYAIANCVPEHELNADYIIPSALDKRVSAAVARAVAEAALQTGVSG